MTNIKQFPSKGRHPDAVDNAGIQAMYLAAPLPNRQLRAMCKLGFEEYDHNVIAIRPKEMTYEECQAILNATKRPLISVETGSLNSLEEALEWLEK